MLFESILSTFSGLGELVKTTLSPESQHDSAGPRGSQNIVFLVFVEVLNLSALLGASFFDTPTSHKVGKTDLQENNEILYQTNENVPKITSNMEGVGVPNPEFC